MKKFLIASMVLFAIVAIFLLTTNHLEWGKSAILRGEYERAYDHFFKSANQGNTEAQFYLGDMFHHGKGVKQDYAKAVEYYQLAVEEQPGAMYGLGMLMIEGKGIERNANEGAKLIFIAAQAGQIDAQFEIGVTFAEGKNGFERDYKKAVEWYSQAALMGHGSAQFQLASMYQFGQGVDNNPAEAYIWYSLAENFGRTDASEIRDYVIAKRITADQIQKANETAKERLTQIEARRASANKK